MKKADHMLLVLSPTGEPLRFTVGKTSPFLNKIVGGKICLDNTQTYGITMGQTTTDFERILEQIIITIACVAQKTCTAMMMECLNKQISKIFILQFRSSDSYFN